MEKIQKSANFSNYIDKVEYCDAIRSFENFRGIRKGCAQIIKDKSCSTE
jgi:hypothetical protein